jgi:hypothetical protein
MSTSSTPAPPTLVPASQLRVRIFVDFWNFSLSLRDHDDSFRVDWKPVGNLFAKAAANLVDPSAHPVFEGMHVYASVDPAKSNDAKLRSWLTNRLDKMPGTHVVVQERQKKRGYQKCPHCQAEATTCDSCGGDLRGTEEKGVDTRIVTDMISLAWANAYDVAMLISADRDFVPVADFLQTKGIKVVHGAFPPKGSHLSQSCWGNLDITTMMPSFRLTTT